jgi:hypothetical protein
MKQNREKRKIKEKVLNGKISRKNELLFMQKFNPVEHPSYDVNFEPKKVYLHHPIFFKIKK